MAALHALCFDTPRPWSEAEFASLLTGVGVFTVGDERCLAMGRAVAGEVELLTLAVHPDTRGQGLGRSTLASFERMAIQRGAVHAFLEVAADNLVAIALYTSAGYHESGRRRGYYSPKSGPAIDALVLTKPLKAT
jgi:ribosomal-protein-alanine N-acetyltransferase